MTGITKKLRGLATQALLRHIAALVMGWFGWPVIITIAAVGGCFAVVAAVAVVAATTQVSDQRDALNYQCQSRLGFSVADTATILAPEPNPTNPASSPMPITALQPATTTNTIPATAPTQTSTPTASSAPTPTNNPYATMTIPTGLNAHDAACAAAIRKGPLIGPPITTSGTALGAHAAAAAITQIGKDAADTGGDIHGPTNNAFSPAQLTRYAWAAASQETILLPEHLDEQITAGDRVDPAHISAGDLVFYNFTATSGPLSVMIATDASHGVAAIPATTIGIADLPTGNVIITRPTTGPQKPLPATTIPAVLR